MCYLDNYICEFEEKYYKLSKEKMKEAISFFYEQLPQNVGNQVKNYYQTQKEKRLLGDTLGGMKIALKDWVEEECNQHKA